MATSLQQSAPSDIPWAAGSPLPPKLGHSKQCPRGNQGQQGQSGLPVSVIHGVLGNPHLTGTSPDLLLLPVQLQLLSLEIELREAWAFPFAQMRWGVLRGRGCYNWITHCVTNHSACNHSDCGFNLTWAFPRHRMTLQPPAAGQAPHTLAASLCVGGAGAVGHRHTLLPSLSWWPPGRVWVSWERGHGAGRTGILWWG